MSINDKKVIITGCAGFIGAALTKKIFRRELQCNRY